MKRTLIFTLTTLMLFFSISHADAGSWLEPSENHNEGGPSATELGIELTTCTPDGMVNSFKEKGMQKAFGSNRMLLYRMNYQADGNMMEQNAFREKETR